MDTLATQAAADDRQADDALWGEHGRRIQFLSRLDLFMGCDRAMLSPVATALKPVSVAPGTAVVREGEPGAQFYLIESGDLEVTVRQNGTSRSVQRLGPGQFFG